MPHKCVKCNKVYDGQLPPVSEGCGCGSRVFLFVKNGDSLAHVRGSNDKYELDLLSIFGKKKHQDTIHSVEDGKYTIDIESMLKGRIV